MLPFVCTLFAARAMFIGGCYPLCVLYLLPGQFLLVDATLYVYFICCQGNVYWWILPFVCVLTTISTWKTRFLRNIEIVREVHGRFVFDIIYMLRDSSANITHLHRSRPLWWWYVLNWWYIHPCVKVILCHYVEFAMARDIQSPKIYQ